MAAGLPWEGEDRQLPHALELAHADIPTCAPELTGHEIQELMKDSVWTVCVVINAARVVLGLVHAEQWRASPDLPASDLMEPAPVTFRPDVSLHQIHARQDKHPREVVLVTTGDGTLLGALPPGVAAEAEEQPTTSEQTSAASTEAT